MALFIQRFAGGFKYRKQALTGKIAVVLISMSVKNFEKYALTEMSE